MISVGATTGLNPVTKNSAYAANAGELVLATATSAFTVTLPATPAVNTTIAIKKTDASTNAVTIAPGGSNTLDVASPTALTVQGQTVILQFDGTSTWQLVGLTPNLTLGTTTTGAAGSNASVTNGGTAAAPVLNFTVPQGATGATGAAGAAGTAGSTGATGPGVATGGTTGQALIKSSATNYATTWQTLVPIGGAAGQVLTKSTATNYDTAWQTVVASGGTAGQALVKNSATTFDASWANVTTPLTPVVVSAAGTTVAVNALVLASASSAAFSLTLPASPVDGSVVVAKKTDTTTNAVTVLPNAGQTINGSTSLVLATQEAAARLVYYASTTRWMVSDTAEPSVASSVITVGSSSSSSSSSTGGSAGFPAWSGSGRYFTSPQSWTNVAMNQVTGSTGLCFFPISIPNACSISAMGYVFAAVSSVTVYVGLFTDVPGSTSGGPAALIGGGTFTPSAGAGFNGYTFGTPLVFTGPQTVWAAYGNSALINTLSNAYPVNNMSLAGTTAAFYNSSNPAYPPNGRYSTTYAYSSSPTNVASSSTNPQSFYVPIFYFKLA